MGCIKYVTLFLSLIIAVYTIEGHENKDFKLGLENIPNSLVNTLKRYNYHGARIGLITNHTGIDQQGNRNIDILRRNGLRIDYIFTPEHGFDGAIVAGHAVQNTRDAKTKIPIISLYGHGTGKNIMHQNMQHIDTLIFDMQDVGMRHYTYISTLLRTMQTASEYNKEFIVLDRPNPLGACMEGPLVSDNILKLNSFIACAPVPLRHGMTVGELAWYFNSHVLKKSVKLHIVKMHHYDRRKGLPGNLQVHLSPNIQTKQACYGYSFLGLLGEVRPFGTGIGSEHAFSYLGLPATYSISEQLLINIKNTLQASGIASSPFTHTNTRSKKIYKGMHIHIADINKVESFNTLLRILKLVKENGIQLQFSDYFNRAVGTDLVQQYIAGKIAKNVLTHNINKGLIQFFTQARKAFMYAPLPQCSLIKE